MKQLIPALAVILTLLALLYSFSGQPATRKIICTPDAPKPIGPYSQGVFLENTLYVAGQVGFTAQGTPDTSSIENECAQAMKNVKAIVEAAGLQMQQVVKATLYVKDLQNFQKINAIYGTYFPKDPPARETIQVAALPKGMHFEISVVAVK
ncbi:MAG: Rid family detoxifying hydrolase [Bacteroidia bacterium]